MKKIMFCALAAAVLAGCGGGGGGGPSAPPPPTSIQGFWAARVDATLSASAVILDNNDAWLVFQSTDANGTPTAITGMARAVMAVTGSNYTGTGSNYDLTANPPAAITLTGTATAKTSLAGSYTIAGAAPKNVTLAYNAAYETPASLADATGHWTGTFGGGANGLNLDVAGTGSITGSSTAGCTYTGTLVPHAANAVFDLLLAENCFGTIVNLQGISTISTSKTSLFLTFTSTPDKARGGLFVGTKGGT
jgi:hypothetical protein